MSFFINTFRNRYFYVGFTLQFPLPAAENIAASLDMGSVITSVSLTAIGAVLDYCLARPSGDDQENSVDELHADPSALLAEQMAALCQSATAPALMDSSGHTSRENHETC